MREQLNMLKEKVEIRSNLKKQIREIEEEFEQLNKKLFDSKIEMHNEQVDVDALNAFSIKNVFYSLTGKKDDLLSKELSEAKAAKERYHALVYRSEQMQRQINIDRDTVLSLKGCEADYYELLKQAVCNKAYEEYDWIERTYIDHLNYLVELCNVLSERGAAIISFARELRENLKNVQDWNRSLPTASWSITMPGYFNGAMKKIEDYRKQIRFFSEDLEAIPLSPEVMDQVESIFVFPQNYFRELTSKIGADERLNEADAAVANSVKCMNSILQNINAVRSDLEKLRV